MLAYSGIDTEYEKIASMVKFGNSAYRIAKNTGYDKNAVLRFIKRHGLVNLNKPKRRETLLKDKQDQVINLYRAGMTARQIGIHLGHGGHYVIQALKKLDLYEKDIYSLDETFFKSIDSQEKAYILGWFYSDGSVDEGGKCRIQIQKEDETILYRIRDLIKYDGPLYEIPPPKKFPHRKSQVCLCVNRQGMAQDLIVLGCVPNKSLTLEYPTCIPKELEHHFLRGMFDGDGTVSVRKSQTSSYAGITSTDSFNTTLQTKLLNLGIETHKYFRRKGKTSCSLITTKNDHTLRLLSYLYQDSKIYLDRKYNKFQQILSSRKE